MDEATIDRIGRAFEAYAELAQAKMMEAMKHEGCSEMIGAAARVTMGQIERPLIPISV